MVWVSEEIKEVLKNHCLSGEFAEKGMMIPENECPPFSFSSERWIRGQSNLVSDLSGPDIL